MKTESRHDESVLSARLIAGDLVAFDALYHRYYQTVFNNVISILKDRQNSEDVVQEVFLALWEKRATLRQPANIGGWLFVTSSNKSLNYLRSKLRTKLNLQSVESFQDIPFITEEDSPFDEQLAILKKALTKLSPQQRKVFQLCKVEGKSYEETAETLRLSHNTVKTHMRLAVSGIREHIMNEPGAAVLTASCMLLLSQI